MYVVYAIICWRAANRRLELASNDSFFMDVCADLYGSLNPHFFARDTLWPYVRSGEVFDRNTLGNRLQMRIKIFYVFPAVCNLFPTVRELFVNNFSCFVENFKGFYKFVMVSNGFQHIHDTWSGFDNTYTERFCPSAATRRQKSPFSSVGSSWGKSLLVRAPLREI